MKTKASLETLRRRQQLISCVRAFFADKEVLEVETPILNLTTTNEVFLDSLETNADGRRLYMHTSPEYAMKKLIADLPVSMYQICKAFRANEVGARHNTEFSMLEWYRVGLDVNQFITEIVGLLEELFPSYLVKRLNYGEIFEKFFGFSPYLATTAELNSYILSKKLLDTPLDYKQQCLDLLFSICIEPSFLGEVFYFVEDFPIEQASLAKEKVNAEGIVVANRFELFVSGVELANGYEELLDADKLKKRMLADIEQRTLAGKHIYPLDEDLILAHQAGIPAMTGASLGLDRLVMLYLGIKDISQVITFKI